MAFADVTVSKFTVQYMLKDLERDMPTMLPLKAYSVDLTLEVPDELAQYLPAYVKGFQGLDPNAAEARVIPEYSAPSEVVKKWKKILTKEYPDAFNAKQTKPDMVIDCAISCTLEDAIKDALEELWDKSLAESLKAVPDVPDGYRIGARYIHLVDWNVK
jgi:hypothetical protein